MVKMRMGMFVAVLLLPFALFAPAALADKSSVVLEGADQAVKGSEVVLRVHVTHSANSFLHHTNWLRVKVNGEEIRSWEYSMNHLPEGAKFTKEVRFPIRETSEVEAEANCNLHGSKGPAKKTITIPTPPR
jgi:desulfoferrodoxin (superoxide reductase-like protein)